MKEIFIGSSKEGLEQATQVAAVLAETQDVKPLLWTEYYDAKCGGFLIDGNFVTRLVYVGV